MHPTSPAPIDPSALLRRLQHDVLVRLLEPVPARAAPWRRLASSLRLRCAWAVVALAASAAA